MANELRLRALESGLTLYAQLGRGTNGDLFNGLGWEAPLTANWATYDLALVEQSTTKLYYGSLPGGLPAGLYDYYVFKQLGGTPASTDEYLGQGKIDWNGTVEQGAGASVPQSGDAYARLGTPAGVSIAADLLAVATITTTVVGYVDTIEARLPAALVGGRMDSSISSYPGNTLQTGDVYAALVSVLWPEPTAVPAASATLVNKLGWLTTLARNKIVQTASLQTVLASNGTTVISTATVSDDGTEFVRNGFS